MPRVDAVRLVQLQDELDSLERRLRPGRVVRTLPVVLAALWLGYSFGWIGDGFELPALLVGLPALAVLVMTPLLRHRRRKTVRREIEQVLAAESREETA